MRRPRQGAGARRPDEDHHGPERAPPVRERDRSWSRSPPRRRSPTASSGSRAARRRSSTSPRVSASRAGTSSEQDPEGLRRASSSSLEQENYEVKTLLLPSVEKIPDDASVVVLAGPGQPLTDSAISALEGLPRAAAAGSWCSSARAGRRASCRRSSPTGASSSGNDIVIDREVRLFEGPRLGV